MKFNQFLVINRISNLNSVHNPEYLVKKLLFLNFKQIQYFKGLKESFKAKPTAINLKLSLKLWQRFC